jgi:putative phosphonate metabolism protein
MRHAIYYVPDPSSALHELGSSWLGRDVISNATLPQTDDRLTGFTMDACRYGFHGTLKPPFHMKENVSVDMFESALRNLANQHESFSIGPIELRMIDGFLALVPVDENVELSHLAADCVQQLDNFRTPPVEAEMRKRRAAGLTVTQDALLQRWGYPYVLEEFRFHLTLTSRLSAEDAEWIYPSAQIHFKSVLGRPLHIDALTHLVERDDGEDFVVRTRLPLVYNALKAA